MSHDMTKPTKWVCAQRIQISLGIRPVWSESSLCAQWVAKEPSFLHADSEDSDQTGRMSRLIWVFAGRTLTLLVLLCRGSIMKRVVLSCSNASKIYRQNGKKCKLRSDCSFNSSWSWSALFALTYLSQTELPHNKTNKMTVRLVKTQISLGICQVCSESSLCAQWVAKDPSFLHADSKDSDQTGRLPRLIWVFAGCTVILLVLSKFRIVKVYWPMQASMVDAPVPEVVNPAWHAVQEVSLYNSW